MTFGLIMAAFYCAYVAVLFLSRGAEPFAKNDTTFGAVVSAYVASGVLGGVAYGLLHPLRATWVGRAAIGIAVGMIAVAAVTLSMSGLPTQWTHADWEAIGVLGAFFGTVGSVLASKQRWG